MTPGVVVGWATVVALALGIVSDMLRRKMVSNDNVKKELKEAEDELRKALLSGDVDRITRARADLDRLQIRTGKV